MEGTGAVCQLLIVGAHLIFRRSPGNAFFRQTTRVNVSRGGIVSESKRGLRPPPMTNPSQNDIWILRVARTGHD